MEIFGLIIIVILFVLILLVFLAFSAQRQAIPPSQELRQSIEIENLLTALMKLTPCTLQAPPDSLDTLIRDCRLAGQDVCGTPCQPYIQATVTEVMRRYGQAYRFEVRTQSSQVLYAQGALCPGDRLVDDYPIKAGQEFLVAELSLCA